MFTLKMEKIWLFVPLKLSYMQILSIGKGSSFNDVLNAGCISQFNSRKIRRTRYQLRLRRTIYSIVLNLFQKLLQMNQKMYR